MNTLTRQAILCLLALMPLTATADTGLPASAVTPIGSFSSIHPDAEHCTGHRLDIWRAHASFLGLFSICSGMTGDIVTAVANISQFDPTSGTVVFETRLSQGTDYLKGGIESPSKDHFTFTGRLANDEITGMLTWSDDNYPTHKPKTGTVHWHRAAARLSTFDSEAAWRHHADELASPASASR